MRKPIHGEVWRLAQSKYVFLILNGEYDWEQRSTYMEKAKQLSHTKLVFIPFGPKYWNEKGEYWEMGRNFPNSNLAECYGNIFEDVEDDWSE